MWPQLLQQEEINLVIAISIVIFANNQCSVWEILFWSSKSGCWATDYIGYSAPDLARIPQRRAALSAARRRPAVGMFPRHAEKISGFTSHFWRNLISLHCCQINTDKPRSRAWLTPVLKRGTHLAAPVEPQPLWFWHYSWVLALALFAITL